MKRNVYHFAIRAGAVLGIFSACSWIVAGGSIEITKKEIVERVASKLENFNLSQMVQDKKAAIANQRQQEIQAKNAKIAGWTQILDALVNEEATGSGPNPTSAATLRERRRIDLYKSALERRQDFIQFPKKLTNEQEEAIENQDYVLGGGAGTTPEYSVEDQAYREIFANIQEQGGDVSKALAEVQKALFEEKKKNLSAGWEEGFKSVGRTGVSAAVWLALGGIAFYGGKWILNSPLGRCIVGEEEKSPVMPGKTVSGKPTTAPKVVPPIEVPPAKAAVAPVVSAEEIKDVDQEEDSEEDDLPAKPEKEEGDTEEAEDDEEPESEEESDEE